MQIAYFGFHMNDILPFQFRYQAYYAVHGRMGWADIQQHVLNRSGHNSLNGCLWFSIFV